MQEPSWRRRALLLVLFCAGPLAAQPAADLPTLRADLKVLDTLTALGVTVTQAQAMLPELGRIQSAHRDLDTAARRRWLEMYDAVVRIETETLAGQTPAANLYQAVNDANQHYALAAEPAQRKITAALEAIGQILTPQQRAWFEPEAARAERLTAERGQRTARSAAVALAAQDLTAWARGASLEEYQQQRDARITKVLATAYPQATADSLAPYRARLATYYDRIRIMQPNAYVDARPQMATQLRGLLPMAIAGRRYLMSQAEWSELLQEPEALVIVNRLTPAGGQ